MQLLKVKTKNNEFDVECYTGFVREEDIDVNKEIFNRMCKEGCVNYGKKYCCPPLTPDFKSLIDEKEGLYIILFKSNLKQINSTEYNKVRIANAAMKSRIIKLMKFLEDKLDTLFLITGSCNLCKPCQLKLNLPCKHPNERRYSLESIGIDCDKLSGKLFNIPLLWYKNKKAPAYTCVICGLLCNKKDEEDIEAELDNLL